MRTGIIGAAMLVVGALAIAFGVIPAPDAVALWERSWPILLFVLAITVVTELADQAGIFAFLAERAAHWSRGRTIVLWLLIVALAVVLTIFLSLDTTAVLLTPIVVLVARHARLDPLPFALTTVWLANTASLLLPVSNLTNLLAQNTLGDPSPVAFTAMTWLPAIIAILIPVAVIFVTYRRSLLTRYEPQPITRVDDPPLAIVTGVAIVALLPLLVSGLPVWMPACAAAVLLLAVFAVRRREGLSLSLVPWSLLLFAAGLFLVVNAAEQLGLSTVLAVVSGRGETLSELLRFSGTGVLGANVINNLPAYLALEPIAHSPIRIVALLIGVNVGPLITPWASLATLLWAARLHAQNVPIPWARILGLGAITAVITVSVAVVGLWAIAG